jgi:hypothetical protein
MSWIIKKLLGASIFLIVFLVALELFSFIATKLKLFPINLEPTFYLTGSRDDKSGMGWRNEREPWGAWHKPNATSSFVNNCSDIIYHSNSIGARDEEFAKIAATKRWLLLGDSFAEGYAVNFENTSQYLIEKQLGIEILNFGTAYDFGPLQYYLLYKELGLKFKHDGLIIYFLPSNDFTDNDFSVWEHLGQLKRYRPYYSRLDNQNYEVFYPKGSIPTDYVDSGLRDSAWDNLKLFAHTFLWSANAIRAFKYVVLQTPIPVPYSGYFDASREQQEAAIHWINKILEITPAKTVLLVSIPSEEDLRRIRVGENLEKQFWYSKFKELPEQRKNFRFLDLSNAASASIDSLFLECDGHWSPEGNRWAAYEIGKVLETLEP